MQCMCVAIVKVQCLLVDVRSHRMYSFGNAVVATRVSVRVGSFSANCGLSTEKIVMIMYYWVYKVKCRHVKLFKEIYSSCNCSVKITTLDSLPLHWFAFSYIAVCCRHCATRIRIWDHRSEFCLTL